MAIVMSISTKTSCPFLPLGVRVRAFNVGMAIIACLVLNAGCSQTLPDRAERMTRGYVYYFDGAGGGGAFSNWSGGLKRGLLDAGYDGAGEIVDWNTGGGVVADQESTVEYKRSKGSECAQKIRQYCNDHPGAPVNVVALSAGTAVALFAVEALPSNCNVDNVFLCGASVSADYDLTRALQHVRNRMYVFTSEKDAVLAFLVPMAGTADRKETDSAGLRGFQNPRRMSAETRSQYSKLVHINWKPEFAKYGDLGGHTDALKAPFVQHFMAPLLMDGMARRVETASSGGKVRNPDYDRWARFNTGASTTFEGSQTINGEKQPIRMIATLISKHEDRLVIERRYTPLEGDPKDASRVQQFLIESEVNPADHPMTSPSAKTANDPDETLSIYGRRMVCHKKTIQAEGDFPEYGRGVRATVWQNESLPGGMARVWLKSSKGNQPWEFRGDVVAFNAR
ncbi:MAG: hypothetical protein HZA51_04825 [Planctomycetes bacterium]|nr:hypothetical protein [Planctomycetota bacterium]